MPRTVVKAPPTREESAPAPIIHPQAVYSIRRARAVLELRDSSLAREIREGRLQVAKRCGRYYLLGEWILDWIAAGKLSARRPPQAGGGA